MEDQDKTGSIAALIALALVIVAWAWNPSPFGITDPSGLERASRQALEQNAVGEPMHWHDKGTGTTATITPARAYRDIGGQLCRPYAVVLASAGKEANSRHVACRDQGGRWTATDDTPPAPNRFDHWLAQLSEPGEQVARTR